jgi:hypothetical protein
MRRVLKNGPHRLFQTEAWRRTGKVSAETGFSFGWSARTSTRKRKKKKKTQI